MSVITAGKRERERQDGVEVSGQQKSKLKKVGQIHFKRRGFGEYYVYEPNQVSVPALPCWQMFTEAVVCSFLCSHSNRSLTKIQATEKRGKSVFFSGIEKVTEPIGLLIHL